MGDEFRRNSISTAVQIRPPPYKPTLSSTTPPPPYPSSSSGSRESCSLDEVRTPTDHHPTHHALLTDYSTRTGTTTSRTLLPTHCVPQAQDIMSPSGARVTYTAAGSRSQSRPSSGARVAIRMSSAIRSAEPTGVEQELSSVRSPRGQDCPQCGLTGNNMRWSGLSRRQRAALINNQDKCDAQGERMCTISEYQVQVTYSADIQ